ncbi:hypothetical protein [Nocardia terpenica]|uniref:hypothetical protein n=1 Tax=Nocardia terpenica TaxID=455432 RepID=UPI0012FDCB3B|nr:hypothetical protein [Nocardia terpenica]
MDDDERWGLIEDGVDPDDPEVQRGQDWVRMLLCWYGIQHGRIEIDPDDPMLRA